MAVMEARVQAVDVPSWPIYALHCPDRPGFLSGIGEGPDGLTAIRIDYRLPGDTERFIVQTTRRDAAHFNGLDFDAVLAALDADEGEPLPLGRRDGGVTGDPAKILVDAAPVDAQMHRTASVAAWAVRLDDVVVLVAAANAVFADHRLRRIHDLAPFKRARSEVVATALRKPRKG
jgi:hypothetical protein